MFHPFPTMVADPRSDVGYREDIELAELSVCRQCRREGFKLFLKGDRCYSDKCSFDRRPYPPGQHGQRRRKKTTEYGVQLREKQKVKRLYGIDERQFRNIFSAAERHKGKTGDNLLSLLERRLDNVIYRLGFASSRREARHFVRHSHFMINNKKIDIPSYHVREGDEVRVHEKSKKIEKITEALAAVERRGVPQWLELDTGAKVGRMKLSPQRTDISEQIQEQLIVELYSK